MRHASTPSWSADARGPAQRAAIRRLSRRRTWSNRRFTADAPNRPWLADITYVPTGQGFLYLPIVLDALSRRIVGCSIASHLRTDLVLGALEIALAQRRPRRVVHHSDRGRQYTSLAFSTRRREAGVLPSMGNAADCFDNAMAESFFASLECELVDRTPAHNRGHAER